MIVSASKYSELPDRKPAAQQRRPTEHSVFAPKFGGRRRESFMDWMVRELKDGGRLKAYLNIEKRTMQRRIRTVARAMHGFQQNNKSDFRRVATVPGRLYQRWKAEDPDFFADDKNLKSLKRDNPDVCVYL
jgi:hypothetical protein